MDPRQYGPEILPHANLVKRRLEERDRPDGEREREPRPDRQGGGRPAAV